MKTIALHPELRASEVMAIARRIGGRIVWLGGHLFIQATGAATCSR